MSSTNLIPSDAPVQNSPSAPDSAGNGASAGSAIGSDELPLGILRPDFPSFKVLQAKNLIPSDAPVHNSPSAPDSAGNGASAGSAIGSDELPLGILRPDFPSFKVLQTTNLIPSDAPVHNSPSAPDSAGNGASDGSAIGSDEMPLGVLRPNLPSFKAVQTNLVVTSPNGVPATTTPQTSSSSDKKLLQPIKIRGVEFPNRVFASPMCQFSAEDGKVTDAHKTPLETITTQSNPAPGLYFVEATAVLPEGRLTVGDAGLWDDSQVGPMKDLVDTAHSKKQLTGIQLSHAGRNQVRPVPPLHPVLGNEPGGGQGCYNGVCCSRSDNDPELGSANNVAGTEDQNHKGPNQPVPEYCGVWNGIPYCVSALPHTHNPDSVSGPQPPSGPVTTPHRVYCGTWNGVPYCVAGFKNFIRPEDLTKDEIEGVIKAFEDAASRAVKAGFDVVELSSAQGTLLSSFLTPFVNRRGDEYGASFEGRVKLVLDVVDAVRAAIPNTMPLFLRISATDGLEDALPEGASWTTDDTLKLAGILVDHGVDFLDVASGGNGADQLALEPSSQSKVSGYSQSVKKVVASKIVVGSVGGYADGKVVEDTLEQGKADVILVGRGLLGNPGLIQSMVEDLGVVKLNGVNGKVLTNGGVEVNGNGALHSAVGQVATA
ncbi:hypothetical protein JAAARDRAFT_196763 [Jaapia argillacea MUCL 33604]|uniref:NADH:flavin oxidoreductase/NADH oxidase N-terminal domain-containing protein n=1 Tax=Jaapia argillacea MUCL 33604 TaxID=933084 RepID=A0A067PVT0_9AGAM|nr:hypothetical protein JAAARDRAFT_196763 [Jaapia argillacea MUCL 33604]